jgi:hypothetical protein
MNVVAPVSRAPPARTLVVCKHGVQACYQLWYWMPLGHINPCMLANCAALAAQFFIVKNMANAVAQPQYTSTAKE